MNKDNKELQTEWYELHKKIVNDIIVFCNEHNIKNAYELGLHADSLNCSIKSNEWVGGTDSSFTLLDKNEEVILCSI